MYLVRLTAGRPVRVRDGVGFKAPMKTVTQDAYILFSNLPAGVSQFGGSGFEVKPVANESEAKKAEAALAEALKGDLAKRDAHAAKVRAKLAKIKDEAAAAAAARAKAAAPASDASLTEKARLAHISTGGAKRKTAAEEN